MTHAAPPEAAAVRSLAKDEVTTAVHDLPADGLTDAMTDPADVATTTTTEAVETTKTTGTRTAATRETVAATTGPAGTNRNVTTETEEGVE